MTNITAAIATIEFSRNTHVEWAAYMRGHNDTVDCNCGKVHPDVNNLGDTAYHENCIAEYDNVLAVLRLAKNPPTQLAYGVSLQLGCVHDNQPSPAQAVSAWTEEVAAR